MSAWGQMDWDKKLKLPKHWVEASLILVLRLGFLFKVGPALTLLLRAAAYLLLPVATGIALLPVAAALSPRETDSKMNLPEGILRPERVAKWLLEEEKAISKKSLFGGGEVWLL